MGNYLTLVLDTVKSGTGRKRKHEDLEDDSDSDFDGPLERKLRTPKRRKLMSTTKYIYKTLFEEGQNSDVQIVALGRTWNLHRVYLCQSPYFASMFSGAWREANADEVHIEIVDSNITLEALNIVLGSLYQDEIVIQAAHVIPVLGAATLFQLDTLIAQCTLIMKETINIQTVTKYYEAAKRYGIEVIIAGSFDWLLRNLLGFVSEHPKKLRDISIDLMGELIKSPSLYVMQTEFSIYVLLKSWMFLLENTSWDGGTDGCSVEAHKFFQQNEDACFLTAEAGNRYLRVFEGLRLQHLITHHIDVEMLETDRIVPIDWLLPVFRAQWYQMLRIDQGVDKGPKQMTEEEFSKVCLRCGRILITDGQHMWRWTGYNFGLDLIVTYDRRVIKFKRNHRTDGEYQSSVSLQVRRNIMYKLTVASLDEQKQISYTATTGLKVVSLGKNEDIRAMTIDKDAAFPLLLSANFAVTTPVGAKNVAAGDPTQSADAPSANEQAMELLDH